MNRVVQNLLSSRQLLRDFVARDLQARYVGSSLGFFWSVVYPVINLAVYMFVFQYVMKATWRPDQGAQEVVMLMLVGIVSWSAFAETLGRGTNILVDNANLIGKLTFPTEILPAYVTVSALVNMLIALPIVLGALVWAMFFPQDDPALVARMAEAGNPGIVLGAAVLWLPLLLLLQAIFTAGVAYFLATFNLFWRDTFHVIGVATMVWMFITPIFYPPEAFVRPPFDFGWMLEINPMHWLIDMYRSALTKNAMPNPVMLAKFTGATAVTFFLGATFFDRQRDRFADLL